MQNANHNNHALINTMARCLSGQWLIEPTWLLNNTDLLMRSEKNEDMAAVWPKTMLTYMVQRDGVYQGTARDGITEKGSALGVLNVVGPIYKYGWNSSKSLIAYLRQLAADEQVGAVKIIVDSPGGQHAGTREVYEVIRDFPKPILSVVDGYMASAALYQHAGADKIVATQPTDMIGSLGTFSTYADLIGYYESIGLKVYETYAPGSTEKNEAFRQLMGSQGKNRELLEKELTVLNDQFIADVREGRGGGLNEVVEKGRLYFAQDAIAMGLIDELVPERETLAMLTDMQQTTKQTTITMDLKEFKNKLSQLLSGADDAPTPEETTDQVAQLTTDRDAAQAQVATLTTQVTTLTTERDAATAQVTTLTTERDAALALADAYGSQPGATPTQVNKAADETPAGEGDTKTWQEVIAALPSEVEAAAQGY